MILIISIIVPRTSYNTDKGDSENVSYMCSNSTSNSGLIKQKTLIQNVILTCIQMISLTVIRKIDSYDSNIDFDSYSNELKLYCP